MYKCNECNSKFEEPKVLIERHGFSYGGYERIKMCPHCKSEDIDEVWNESEDDE